MRCQKSAEAIVGDEAEGPNKKTESRTDDLDAKPMKQKHPQGWPRRGSAGRKPSASRAVRRLTRRLRANEIGGPQAHGSRWSSAATCSWRISGSCETRAPRASMT